MPRNVRNFWMEGETDNGTRFGTGPRSAGGGMQARIYIREDGGVQPAFTIRCRAIGDGGLVVEVWDEHSKLVTSRRARR